MSSSNCCSKNNCSVFALAASLIIGIVAAFLRITATIVVSDAFLWVLFGIAIVYLGVLVVVSAFFRRCYNCVETPILLAGILGTVLLSVILLGIDFVATSVVGAIAVGLLLFFFSLTVGASACLVRCLSDSNSC